MNNIIYDNNNQPAELIVLTNKDDEANVQCTKFAASMLKHHGVAPVWMDAADDNAASLIEGNKDSTASNESSSTYPQFYLIENGDYSQESVKFLGDFGDFVIKIAKASKKLHDASDDGNSQMARVQGVKDILVLAAHDEQPMCDSATGIASSGTDTDGRMEDCNASKHVEVRLVVHAKDPRLHLESEEMKQEMEHEASDPASDSSNATGNEVTKEKAVKDEVKPGIEDEIEDARLLEDKIKEEEVKEITDIDETQELPSHEVTEEATDHQDPNQGDESTNEIALECDIQTAEDIQGKAHGETANEEIQDDANKEQDDMHGESITSIRGNDEANDDPTKETALLVEVPDQPNQSSSLFEEQIKDEDVPDKEAPPLLEAPVQPEQPLVPIPDKIKEEEDADEDTPEDKESSLVKAPVQPEHLLPLVEHINNEDNAYKKSTLLEAPALKQINVEVPSEIIVLLTPPPPTQPARSLSLNQEETKDNQEPGEITQSLSLVDVCYLTKEEHAIHAAHINMYQRNLNQERGRTDPPEQRIGVKGDKAEYCLPQTATLDDLRRKPEEESFSFFGCCPGAFGV